MQDGQRAEALGGPAAGTGQGSVLVREVEAGDRLVEQEEGQAFRVGVALRQDAGQLDALALPSGQDGVGTVGEGDRLGLRQGILGEDGNPAVGQAGAVGEQAELGDLTPREIEGHCGMLGQDGTPVRKFGLLPVR